MEEEDWDRPYRQSTETWGMHAMSRVTIQPVRGLLHLVMIGCFLVEGEDVARFSSKVLIADAAAFMKVKRFDTQPRRQSPSSCI